MAPPPILDRAFVEQLIAAELPEDQELEYKRDLPRPKQAKETKTDPLEEFAKDVSAMANASGGVLLFGIEEDGKTKKPTLHH
jgi:predicted HTH transcriptional regulator